MYNINGDFGSVRLCKRSILKNNLPIPYRLIDGGWHQCNEKYHILREMGQNQYILFFCISDGGLLRIENKAYKLSSGSIAILPPNTSHEYCTEKGQIWEFYWLRISGTDIELLLEHVTHTKGYIYEKLDLHIIIEKIESIFSERFLEASDIYDIRVSQVLSEILHEFLLKIYSAKGSKNPALFEKILRELELNYKNQLNINQMAKENFISVQYLIKVFKTKTEYTPYEYLKKYRIMKSCDLLAYSDKTINEIAEETGFASTSNFIAQFKKEKCLTPGKYRKKFL